MTNPRTWWGLRFIHGTPWGQPAPVHQVWSWWMGWTFFVVQICQDLQFIHGGVFVLHMRPPGVNARVNLHLCDNFGPDRGGDTGVFILYMVGSSFYTWVFILYVVGWGLRFILGPCFCTWWGLRFILGSSFYAWRAGVFVLYMIGQGLCFIVGSLFCIWWGLRFFTR